MSLKSIGAQLKDQGAKISKILYSEGLIREISPLVEERINLLPGGKCFLKIQCRSQPTPLRLHIELLKGTMQVFLAFSFTNERPNKNKNEKVFSLLKRNKIIQFAGGKDRELLFKEKYIFMGFEAEREALITCEFSFGKSKSNLLYDLASTFTKRPQDPESSIKTEARKKVMRISEINTVISQIVSSPIALEECLNTAAAIRKKRMDRFLRLSGQINIVDRNKGYVTSFMKDLMLKTGRKKLYSAESKQQLILKNKTEREDRDLTHKFLLLHRADINRKHVWENL